jgi:hypothetical protein
MPRLNLRITAVIFASLLLNPLMHAQAVQGYHKAPAPIPQILDARPTPLVLVSPKSDYLLVADRLGNPPLADLAEPMLRLAGIRINPAINGRHHPPRLTGLHIIRISDGKEEAVQLPPDAYLSAPEWSPDGQHFAFTNTVSNAIELWVGDTASGKAHRIAGIKVNAVVGEPVQWMPDSHTLLVETISQTRGNPPGDSRIPDGPIIQESDGKKAPAATFEDLLQSSHDEDLFDYYATSQLTLVDISGHTTAVGKPAIFARIDPSPDGAHILVARIHRPYSYLLPLNEFPKEVEVWNQKGQMEFKLASLPLAEHVPIEGVLTGPRDYQWISTQPATLAWAEALDGGDTRAKVPYHDHLLMLAAPFKDQPKELVKLEYRFGGGGGGPGGGGQNMGWGENGIGLVRDFDRNRRWTRTFMININQPGARTSLPGMRVQPTRRTTFCGLPEAQRARHSHIFPILRLNFSALPSRS